MNCFHCLYIPSVFHCDLSSLFIRGLASDISKYLPEISNLVSILKIHLHNIYIFSSVLPQSHMRNWHSRGITAILLSMIINRIVEPVTGSIVTLAIFCARFLADRFPRRVRGVTTRARQIMHWSYYQLPSKYHFRPFE